MANYYSMCRTNYFSVTNEARFREIINKCSGEDECVLIQCEEDKSKFGFYCECNLTGLFESTNESACEACEDKACYDCGYVDYDGAFDNLLKELQKILPVGEAIIITEVGNEKMRYLSGFCTIITKDKISWLDLRDLALKKARRMLRNPSFTTQMEY